MANPLPEDAVALQLLIEELSQLYVESSRFVPTLDLHRVGTALNRALDALDRARRSIGAARAAEGSLEAARADLDHARSVLASLREGR